MKGSRWIALVLVMAMLLTGCSGLSFQELMNQLMAPQVTPFDQMQYTRPDLEKMESELEECLSLAATTKNKNTLIDQVWVFYDLYNSFYTNYNLACIYYFRDMTASQWEEEYNFCLQNEGNADAMLEEMFYALADCPLRDELEADPAFGEGFFDGYEGESVWDENFLRLVEQEAALEEQYYQLFIQAQEEEYYSQAYFEIYGTKMADVFVELVKVRQEMAKYAGYEDYPSFAYDFYHYRDYTPQQARDYLLQIRDELVPLYRQVAAEGGAAGNSKLSSQKQTFAYVENSAMAMGGTVKNAFLALKEAGLYDLAMSDKKYDTSFEVYLTDYNSPFVFVNPTGYLRDQLTFAHEFGHFCNDYAAYGSYAGVDVAEVFSQGFEYLSLCYGAASSDLAEVKMEDSLYVYVEQAAYALFEHQVYDLEGEELTAENVFALYEKIGKEFGLDAWQWDSRDFVIISHFFTEPMYIISYVVSNDAAMQLYQMEKIQAGSGLALYERHLATEQTYFLAFVAEAGLESPFADGRVAEVKKTLEDVLK